MVCGRRPAPIEQRLTPRQVRADLPRAFDDVIVKALDRQYGSAAEVRGALARVDLIEEPVAAPFVGARPGPRTRSHFRRDGLIVGIVLVVAMVSILIGVLFASDAGRRVIDGVVPRRGSTTGRADSRSPVERASSGIHRPYRRAALLENS